MMLTRALALLATLSFVGPALAQAGAPIETPPAATTIDINRRFTTGDRFRVDASHIDAYSIVAKGPYAEEMGDDHWMQISVGGLLLVVDDGRRSGALRFALVLEELEVQALEGRGLFLAPGMVIDGQMDLGPHTDGLPVFTGRNQTLGPDDAELLTEALAFLVATMTNESGREEEPQFGFDQPRTPGQSWPLADDLLESLFLGSPADVEGTISGTASLQPAEAPYTDRAHLALIDLTATDCLAAFDLEGDRSTLSMSLALVVPRAEEAPIVKGLSKVQLVYASDEPDPDGRMTRVGKSVSWEDTFQLDVLDDGAWDAELARLDAARAAAAEQRP